MLFVISGSVWSAESMAIGIGLGVAIIVTRQLAKTAVVVALSRPSGISVRQGLALGLGLAPVSGAALVLLADLQSLYPHFAATLTHMIFSAIAILELAGPIAVHYALRMVREDNIR